MRKSSFPSRISVQWILWQHLTNILSVWFANQITSNSNPSDLNHPAWISHPLSNLITSNKTGRSAAPSHSKTIAMNRPFNEVPHATCSVPAPRTWFLNGFPQNEPNGWPHPLKKKEWNHKHRIWVSNLRSETACLLFGNISVVHQTSITITIGLLKMVPWSSCNYVHSKTLQMGPLSISLSHQKPPETSIPNSHQWGSSLRESVSVG